MKPASAGSQRRRRVKEIPTRHPGSRNLHPNHNKHSLPQDFVPEPGYTYAIRDSLTGLILVYDISHDVYRGFYGREFYFAPMSPAPNGVYRWQCKKAMVGTGWVATLSPNMTNVEWGKSYDQVKGQLKVKVDSEVNAELFGSTEVQGGDEVTWSLSKGKDGYAMLQAIKFADPEDIDVMMGDFKDALENKFPGKWTEFRELVMEKTGGYMPRSVEWMFVRLD